MLLNALFVIALGNIKTFYILNVWFKPELPSGLQRARFSGSIPFSDRLSARMVSSGSVPASRVAIVGLNLVGSFHHRPHVGG